MGIGSIVNEVSIKNNTINLRSSDVGDLELWDSFGIGTSAIKVVSGNATIVDNNINASGNGIYAKGNEIIISNNNLTVISNDNDAYGIYAIEVANLTINENNLSFTGATTGYSIDNGVYIESSDNAIISNNNFDLNLISTDISWFEIPAGSNNWVSSLVSEGILVKDSKDVQFKNNIINIEYGAVVGNSTYDTIYCIDFKNSENAIISDNKITALGHSYIYGLVISGLNFDIKDNDFEITSDIYYANGIDVEGPASGIISGNNISIVSPVSAYPIYAAMSNGDVLIGIEDNNITANAYFVCGIEVGGEEIKVLNNIINITGNYTVGIGSVADKITANNNTIIANGSNEGSLYVWDSIGVDNAGIKINKGSLNITDNNITSTGLDIKINGNNITIRADNIIKAYNSAIPFKATLYGFDAVVLANETITITVGSKTYNVKTDANGILSLDLNLNVGTYTVNVVNPVTDEKSQYSLKIVSRFSGNSNIVMDYYDGSSYKVRIYGDDGKVVGAGQKVTIKINSKTYTATTDKNGYITYKITELPKSGKYTISATYKGQTIKNTVQVKQVLKSSKVTIKKTAKKLTLKATLKTSKGKSIKSKKVTFKFNGKLYSAKTDSKGIAKITIKKNVIKKLKKGKSYTVQVTYIKDTIKSTVKVKK